jgi:hypothetical protein
MASHPIMRSRPAAIRLQTTPIKAGTSAIGSCAAVLVCKKSRTISPGLAMGWLLNWNVGRFDRSNGERLRCRPLRSLLAITRRMNSRVQRSLDS